MHLYAVTLARSTGVQVRERSGTCDDGEETMERD